MHPLNDVALIEIEMNQYKLNGIKLAGGDTKQGTETGILLELPKEIPYVGFHAFAFENSLANVEVLKVLADYYKKLIGKRVYWTAMSDRGTVLSKDDTTYALIKLTDLIGWSEPDEVYRGEDHSKLI
jgi:hypothetical protein